MMSTFPASLLILNGKGANEPQLREAVNLLRDEGIDIHVRVTWEKGDAARFIDEALQLNVETVIAGGGDGTINEVATALVERGGKMALGILPLGTANDFATSVGIPQDLASALKLAIVGRDVPIDIARVNDKTGFINMATGGFGTRITTETPEKLKAALGGVSYLIHGLMRMDTLKPDRCEIRGENFHWQGDALVIGIGNGRQAGGGQVLCPEALVDDGLLDISILPAPQEIVGTLKSLMAEGWGLDNLFVRARLPWVEIKTAEGLAINLDGEPLAGDAVRFAVRKGALKVHLPPGSPLLGQ